MSVAGRLRALLGVADPVVPSRLSSDEVRKLAADALGDVAMPLAVEPPSKIDGRLVWTVRTATKGSGATILVDDATATVIDLTRWGVR